MSTENKPTIPPRELAKHLSARHSIPLDVAQRVAEAMLSRASTVGTLILSLDDLAKRISARHGLDTHQRVAEAWLTEATAPKA